MEDIRGYENEYAVTRGGAVYCFALDCDLNTVRKPEGFIRRIYETRRYGVKVCVEVEVYLPKKNSYSSRDKYKKYYLKDLVAEAFIPKPDSSCGWLTEYINGDGKNNSVDNIRWKYYK